MLEKKDYQFVLGFKQAKVEKIKTGFDSSSNYLNILENVLII